MLGLIALAIGARIVTRPKAADVPAVAAIDASVLEDSSEGALKAGRARAKPLGRDERIDVNTASEADVDRLPGVGPALARRIVEERERGGAFDSSSDLRSVRGIGPALLAKFEPHLAFGYAPGLQRRSAAPAGASGSGRGAADRTTGRRQSPGPGSLDLNEATAGDLDALPGVGPALAARIIAKRDSMHGFSGIDDLSKVRGIGKTKLEKLRPFFRP